MKPVNPEGRVNYLDQRPVGISLKGGYLLWLGYQPDEKGGKFTFKMDIRKQPKLINMTELPQRQARVPEICRSSTEFDGDEGSNYKSVTSHFSCVSKSVTCYCVGYTSTIFS